MCVSVRGSVPACARPCVRARPPPLPPAPPARRRPGAALPALQTKPARRGKERSGDHPPTPPPTPVGPAAPTAPAGPAAGRGAQPLLGPAAAPERPCSRGRGPGGSRGPVQVVPPEGLATAHPPPPPAPPHPVSGRPLPAAGPPAGPRTPYRARGSRGSAGTGGDGVPARPPGGVSARAAPPGAPRPAGGEGAKGEGRRYPTGGAQGAGPGLATPPPCRLAPCLPRRERSAGKGRGCRAAPAPGAAGPYLRAAVGQLCRGGGGGGAAVPTVGGPGAGAAERGEVQRLVVEGVLHAAEHASALLPRPRAARPQPREAGGQRLLPLPRHGLRGWGGGDPGSPRCPRCRCRCAAAALRSRLALGRRAKRVKSSPGTDRPPPRPAVTIHPWHGPAAGPAPSSAGGPVPRGGSHRLARPSLQAAASPSPRQALGGLDPTGDERMRRVNTELSGR